MRKVVKAYCFQCHVYYIIGRLITYFCMVWWVILCFLKLDWDTLNKCSISKICNKDTINSKITSKEMCPQPYFSTVFRRSKSRSYAFSIFHILRVTRRRALGKHFSIFTDKMQLRRWESS